MKYKLGLHKSITDERDYLVKSFLKDEGLPIRYDLTEMMTPVRNQQNEGSCVGFAMSVGVKEYQEQIDYTKHLVLSPRYIYEKAKIISGHTEGTTLKAAMQVAKEDGVCEERFWPYIPNEVNSPAPIADENASKYKIKAYARITNLQELKQAIVKFGAILIGVEVFKNIKKTGNDGIVPDPNRKWPSNWRSLGGHAVCAVGYDDRKKLVKFKNSWGEGWGFLGYGFLSYNYIRKYMMDAFSCIDILDDNQYIETVADLSYMEMKTLWI